MLIKSIAQAIPNYIMSCFAIPKAICEKIESTISNFWRDGIEDGFKIHWISWSKLCMGKDKGDTGFRILQDFNTALLAKQCWRLENNTSSLADHVLKGRYNPN